MRMRGDSHPFFLLQAAVRYLSPDGGRQPAGGQRAHMNCIAVHIAASTLLGHGPYNEFFRLAADTGRSEGRGRI